MFKSRPSFASAMGMFTKAREELNAAKEINAVEMAEAQKKLEVCTVEDANINNALKTFDKLLGVAK